MMHLIQYVFEGKEIEKASKKMEKYSSGLLPLCVCRAVPNILDVFAIRLFLFVSIIHYFCKTE